MGIRKRRIGEFAARPAVALGSVTALVLIDVIALLRVGQTSTFDVVPAMSVGLAAAALWGAATLSWWRLSEARRRPRVRAVLGWASILILVYWCLCLGTTIPRFGPSKVGTPFGYATLTAGAALGAILVVVGVMRLRQERGAPPDTHQPDSLVEVWHVQSKDLDYFLARCECDWVGPAHDNDSPEAEAAAWADARGHGTNVGPIVVEIPI